MKPSGHRDSREDDALSTLTCLSGLRRRCLLALAVLLLGSGLNTFAQNSAEGLKALEAAMQREIDAKPKADEQRTGERFQPRELGHSILAQIRNALTRGEMPQIEESLAQVSSYFKSAEVLKQAEALGASCEKNAS